MEKGGLTRLAGIIGGAGNGTAYRFICADILQGIFRRDGFFSGKADTGGYREEEE